MKRRYLFDEELLNTFNESTKDSEEEQEIEDNRLKDSIKGPFYVFSIENGSGSYTIPKELKNINIKEILSKYQIKKIKGIYKGEKENSYLTTKELKQDLIDVLVATKQDSILHVDSSNSGKLIYLTVKENEATLGRKESLGKWRELDREDSKPESYSEIDGKFYVVDEKQNEENFEQLTSEEISILRKIIEKYRSSKDDEIENSENEEKMEDEDNRLRDSFRSFNTMFDSSSEESDLDDQQADIISAWKNRR